MCCIAAGGLNTPNAAEPLEYWSLPDTASALHAVERSAPVVCLPVPYQLPPRPYSPEDTPWSFDARSPQQMLLKYPERDVNGCHLYGLLDTSRIYGHKDNGPSQAA